MSGRLVQAALGVAVVFAALVVQSPAHAALNALDPLPGASLLFPYFEADTANPNGSDTLVSFHNASATAVLDHVTVWTDLGVPVLTFNVYLTGYDITSFSMRDMLVNGNLPRTASAGQDPGDHISHHGVISQDINFASCSGQLPYPDGALFTSTRADLRAVLSGHAATFLDGKCAAADHGDSIARGYVTVDVVNNCTQRGPMDPGYFASGGAGDATNQSVMSGEYFLVDASHSLLHQGEAVTLEAAPYYYGGGTPDPSVTTPGNYTFYGRMLGWNAADNREALPTTWAVDAEAAGTELIVWRDTKANVVPFTCGQGPGTGFPLGQESAFSFDNREQPLAIPPGAPFGLATQRVVLGSQDFPVAAKPGWVYLGLSYLFPDLAANPTQDPAADQAYVAVLQYPESHAASTGAEAIALDGAQTARHVHPNTP